MNILATGIAVRSFEQSRLSKQYTLTEHYRFSIEYEYRRAEYRCAEYEYEKWRQLPTTPSQPTATRQTLSLPIPEGVLTNAIAVALPQITPCKAPRP